MHDHQMNPPPTIVAKRKNHLVSGSRGPPLASCQDAGERKRVAVASAKPPIHIGGKMTFMKKVWADERVRGVVATVAAYAIALEVRGAEGRLIPQCPRSDS